MKIQGHLIAIGLLVGSCSTTGTTPPETKGSPLQAEVQAFLDRYTERFLELATASNEAEWISNTHIVEGDDTNRLRTTAANEAQAAFTGSVENIEKARAYL